MTAGKKTKMAVTAAIPALGLAAALATSSAPAQALTAQPQAQTRVASCHGPLRAPVDARKVNGQLLNASVAYNRSHCVQYQFITWNGRHPGVSERVQLFGKNGRLARQVIIRKPSNAGVPGNIDWISGPYTGVYKVSLAVVQSNHTNHVVAGPYTFNTSR